MVTIPNGWFMTLFYPPDSIYKWMNQPKLLTTYDLWDDPPGRSTRHKVGSTSNLVNLTIRFCDNITVYY